MVVLVDVGVLLILRFRLRFGKFFFLPFVAVLQDLALAARLCCPAARRGPYPPSLSFVSVHSFEFLCLSTQAQTETPAVLPNPGR